MAAMEGSHSRQDLPMNGLSGQVGENWSPNVVVEHPKALVREYVLTFGKLLLAPVEMKGHVATATEAAHSVMLQVLTTQECVGT
jgi:hypothetical protein